jgi:peptidyl-prolyl cis-trans isomerase SurA
MFFHKVLAMVNRSTSRPAAIALAGCLLAGMTVDAEIIEQVLVRVNGDIFTKSDLETRQIAALRQMGQQFDQKTGPTDAQLRKMLDEVTPQLLVNTIDEMLIVQRGRELGYTMGNDQFQSVLESIKKDNNIENDEQFQAALKQENMTLADLRRNIERQMIVSRVQQNEVLSKVSVNDEETRRYYEAHLKEFTSPQSITLREILVSVPGDGKTLNVGADENARDKAIEIRKRALAGESFEKLAGDLSDAPSRANAGLIGPLNVTDLSADLWKLLEPMKPGDLTEPLRSTRGYQILKLESVSPPEIAPFDKAREQVSNRIFTEKRNQEMQKYLVKLRAQAIIDWKNKDLKKAYEQGVQKLKIQD